MSDNSPQPTSTKPYLVRAIYEWCTDNGYTPYVAVFVNAAARVPMEYVKNREIVLNISFEATQGLKIDNEAISFRARFAGVARDLYVPTDNIVAVYARENGQGMAFPLTPELQREQASNVPADSSSDAPVSEVSHSAEGKKAKDSAKGDAPASAPRKPRLASVETTGSSSDSSAKAARRKATNSNNGVSSIHAVGPEDTKPDTEDTSSSTPTSDDDDPKGPDGKGTGGPAPRPSLKRIK
jgi:stringent starvation protein B